ncbi:MAG: sulfotransferase [Porphyrobacter sp.]|nr:sulfotransferase [Porphyrobacter sp.]
MPTTTVLPPRRTRFIDLLDGWLRLARKAGWIEPPRLEREALLANAMDYTGLADFGDPWFVEPFEKLLEALHGEARLNAAGEWAAKKQFEKVLHDRLWAEQWFASHPEILARPLPHPVVIVGPMRSGTTRLHRLLSTDTRFTHMRSFETISPVPRPDFDPREPDSRVVLAARLKRIARLSNPHTLTIHPTGPYEPEEELGLFCSSFWGLKHPSQWWVPSYNRWCEGRDATGAYEQVARLLKLVGWAQQASSLRPWVLKAAQHMFDLPALLRVFPDARLIFTHRDPLSVVGSSASLAWNQTIIYSNHAEPNAIGEEWLRLIAASVERVQAARSGIPVGRFIDVHFEEMESDWRAAMRRVYAFLGFDIEPALPAMADYQRRTHRRHRRPHRYSLEEFGLTPGRVLDELGDYMRTYDIAPDVKREAAAV